MSRYIDADTLKVSITNYGALHISHKKLPIVKNEAKELIRDICFAIDAQSTVDAVPVVHGHWEEEQIVDDSTIIKIWQSARCAKCGRYHTTPYAYYFDKFNYCPQCGAKMDEVTE